MKNKQVEEIAKDDTKFKWFVVSTLFKMESRVSKLEVKSGVWGFVGGIFTLAIALGTGFIKIKQ